MAEPNAIEAFGDEGRIRNWLHTKSGARFMNAQTAWFRVFAPRGYGVLTTTGRRTGRARQSCVRAVVNGNEAILVATGARTCDWFRNLEENPSVTLRLGRHDRAGVARVADGPDLASLSERFCIPVYLFDRVASVVNHRGLPRAERIRADYWRWCQIGAIAVVELASG